MKITCLIPAFNEEDYIGETVMAARAMPDVTDVVVIDDGSTDRTKAEAERAGARVIALPQNYGKGQALNMGWKGSQADIYLLLDADLGSTAQYAKRLLEPIKFGDADMTIADFSAEQTAGSGKMGFGIVKRFAAYGILLMTGYRFRAPLSGQRAVTNRLLSAVNGFAQGFGVEVALTVQALHCGFRVVEVPLPMKHRPTGRGITGFVHRGRQLLAVAQVFYRLWRDRDVVRS